VVGVGAACGCASGGPHGRAVYLAREGSDGPIVYIGMAGEPRSRASIRVRPDDCSTARVVVSRLVEAAITMCPPGLNALSIHEVETSHRSPS
jgi:hypothetical protein